MRLKSGFQIAPNWLQIGKMVKFHANIITGSGVMTVSFYKGLTRSPEIGNTPV